jgi:prepilin-type N-terminal cleavage/methylation domain-containing protein
METMPTPTGWNVSGFALLELLVVMAIVALLARRRDK